MNYGHNKWLHTSLPSPVSSASLMLWLRWNASFAVDVVVEALTAVLSDVRLCVSPRRDAARPHRAAPRGRRRGWQRPLVRRARRRAERRGRLRPRREPRRRRRHVATSRPSSTRQDGAAPRRRGAERRQLRQCRLRGGAPWRDGRHRGTTQIRRYAVADPTILNKFETK